MRFGSDLGEIYVGFGLELGEVSAISRWDLDEIWVGFG